MIGAHPQPFTRQSPQGWCASTSAHPNQPLEVIMERTALLARVWISLAVSLLAAANVSAGVVTTTGDSGPGSLRDTLALAASGDTITFSLTLPATIALLSELPITQSVTIQGPGAGSLT